MRVEQCRAGQAVLEASAAARGVRTGAVFHASADPGNYGALLCGAAFSAHDVLALGYSLPTCAACIGMLCSGEIEVLATAHRVSEAEIKRMMREGAKHGD